MLQASSSETRKWEGRVSKMYDMIGIGSRQITHEQSIKLWQMWYTGCIMLENDIQSEAENTKTEIKVIVKN